jgi:MFS transporter, FSR family, fosmidomycin resistance protein
VKLRSLSLLVIAHAAADIGQGAIPAMLPFFIAAHHLSYTAAAGIVFAVNLISTTTQPAFGYMTDRRARPWLIPLSMLAISLGVAFTGILPSYHLGLASLVLTGLGIAVFHPEGARLMNHLAGDQKATAMSLFGIGGQLGFVIGPLVATAALLAYGLKGTVVLVLPAIVAAAIVMFKLPSLSAGYDTKARGKNKAAPSAGHDAWPAFTCLACVLLSRSVIFYGLNTFLALYWINVLHQSKAAGGTALAILFSSTIVGNFLGGRTADRVGYRTVTVVGFAILAVLLPLFIFANNVLALTLLLIPIGLVISAPFGPMVALGQLYLPNRVGMASGITLGLAFSFGGLTTPLLGWIADHHGLRAAIGSVAFIPILSTALALMLPSVERATGMAAKT